MRPCVRRASSRKARRTRSGNLGAVFGDQDLAGAVGEQVELFAGA